jgi:hypothetical protein
MEQWTSRVSSAWQNSTASIIETGRLLIEAKESFEHGEWMPLVESRLPFTVRTANRLMKIAADERLSKPAHMKRLPPHWGTLYELTKLKADVFERAVADGTINPKMTRKKVAALRERNRARPGLSLSRRTVCHLRLRYVT